MKAEKKIIAVINAAFSEKFQRRLIFVLLTIFGVLAIMMARFNGAHVVTSAVCFIAAFLVKK